MLEIGFWGCGTFITHSTFIRELRVGLNEEISFICVVDKSKTESRVIQSLIYLNIISMCV